MSNVWKHPPPQKERKKERNAVPLGWIALAICSAAFAFYALQAHAKARFDLDQYCQIRRY